MRHRPHHGRFGSERQPLSLQEIGYKKLCSMIIFFYDLESSFSILKETWREYICQLPATVRNVLLQELKQMCPKGSHAACPYHLYIHELLLTPCTCTFSMYVPKSFKRKHLSSVIKLLAQNSKELRLLELKKPYWLSTYRCSITNYSHFTSIFQSAKHLTCLTLHKLCDDTVMKLVGENCTVLQTLDISGSRQVTFKGVHLLTQNITRVKSENQPANSSWESISLGLPNMFLPLEEFVPVGESVKEYVRSKSPLCNTLKVLILDNGMLRIITVKGLFVILELVPNLESFGCMDMKDFFLRLQCKLEKCEQLRNVTHVPSLNLTYICFSSYGLSAFELMCNICPKLNYLEFKGNTVHMPTFNYLKQLESLSISGILISKKLDLVDDISAEAKKSLKFLTLHNEKFNATFRLYSVFSQFPHLHELKLRSLYFTWGREDLANSSPLLLQHLTSIDFCGSVSAEAVINIFKCTPNLEIFNVDRIFDKPTNFLQRLCEIRKLPKLETFWVSREYFLTREPDVSFFCNTFRNIRSVGSLPCQYPIH